MDIQCTDTSSSLMAKRGPDSGNDSDNSLDDIDHFLSSLPSLSKSDSVDGHNNKFLRLTTEVRDAYTLYLQRCLFDNYLACYKQNDEHTTNIEVKRCTNQMELNAMQLAVEANLYRQNMLRMIADVRSHTIMKKAYKSLATSLEVPKDKIDVTIQTDNVWTDLCERDKIQSICVAPNFKKALRTTSPTTNSINLLYKDKHVREFGDPMDIEVSHKEHIENEVSNNSQVLDNVISIRDQDENTQDSLLQHMEDMFPESDDSTDLTKLIEKHSDVTKANMDKEISEICLNENVTAILNQTGLSQINDIPKPNMAKTNKSNGKISFSHYKEMRNRKAENVLKEISQNEIMESKKQKTNAVWFVERVHEVSKLKTKMSELSLTNYRKYGKVKRKFVALFGESDEEDTPDSPICIENYLPACKERIASWIVKYLMPFYKQKRIKDRELFKLVAKHITDNLIIEKTFPEQDYVNKYIANYFKNKKNIQTKRDVYM